jgi:hypothetical protein
MNTQERMAPAADSASLTADSAVAPLVGLNQQGDAGNEAGVPGHAGKRHAYLRRQVRRALADRGSGLSIRRHLRNASGLHQRKGYPGPEVPLARL